MLDIFDDNLVYCSPIVNTDARKKSSHVSEYPFSSKKHNFIFESHYHKSSSVIMTIKSCTTNIDGGKFATTYETAYTSNLN